MMSSKSASLISTFMSLHAALRSSLLMAPDLQIKCDVYAVLLEFSFYAYRFLSYSRKALRRLRLTVSLGFMFLR